MCSCVQLLHSVEAAKSRTTVSLASTRLAPAKVKFLSPLFPSTVCLTNVSLTSTILSVSVSQYGSSLFNHHVAHEPQVPFLPLLGHVQSQRPDVDQRGGEESSSKQNEKDKQSLARLQSNLAPEYQASSLPLVFSSWRTL